MGKELFFKGPVLILGWTRTCLGWSWSNPTKNKTRLDFKILPFTNTVPWKSLSLSTPLLTWVLTLQNLNTFKCLHSTMDFSHLTSLPCFAAIYLALPLMCFNPKTFLYLFLTSQPLSLTTFVICNGLTVRGRRVPSNWFSPLLPQWFSLFQSLIHQVLSKQGCGG